MPRRDGYRPTGKELGSISSFWTLEERDRKSLCRTDSTARAERTAMPLSGTETNGLWPWGCSVMPCDAYLQQNPGEMSSELTNGGDTGYAVSAVEPADGNSFLQGSGCAMKGKYSSPRTKDCGTAQPVGAKKRTRVTRGKK